MKILTTNVALLGPHGPTTLYAGQQLPSWAKDKVGGHALADAEPTPETTAQQAAKDAQDDADTAQQAADAAKDAQADADTAQQAAKDAQADADNEQDADEDEGDDAPDFTGPAKPTRTRSARKG